MLLNPKLIAVVLGALVGIVVGFNVALLVLEGWSPTTLTMPFETMWLVLTGCPGCDMAALLIYPLAAASAVGGAVGAFVGWRFF